VGSRSVAPDDDPHLTTADRAASLYRTLRRSEASGLHWTSQQLGSALGVAVIGSIVLSGLTSGFASSIENDTALDEELRTELVTAIKDGVDFSSVGDVEQQLLDAGLDAESTATVDRARAGRGGAIGHGR